MFLVGDGHTNMKPANTLQPDKHPFSIREFDYVITNPPYGNGTIQAKTDALSTVRTEIAFLCRIRDFMRVGSRACVIQPDGILENPSYRAFRRELLETLEITAIVSLPKFAFAPYTKEKTYAVFFTKRNNNQTQVQKGPIWMYIIDNDGLANSDKRFPTKLRNNRNGWIHDEISGWVTTDGEEMPGVLEERWLVFDDTKTNGTEWLDEKGIRRKARKGGMIPIETILNDKYLTLLPEYHLRPQQLMDTLGDYHSYQARDVPASDLFSIVGGNSGLTEEYLYSLLQYPGPREYTLLTGSVDISEAIPIFQCQHPQNADRKITVVDDEGIHIVRKGKAGHINYLPEGRWTMTDDAYVLVNKKTHPYKLLLPWVVLTQQQLFKEYASNSDNGTWNKTGFLTHATFDIPSVGEQEAVIKRATSG